MEERLAAQTDSFDIPIPRMSSLITSRITETHSSKTQSRAIKKLSTLRKNRRSSIPTRWTWEQQMKEHTKAKKARPLNKRRKSTHWFTSQCNSQAATKPASSTGTTERMMFSMRRNHNTHTIPCLSMDSQPTRKPSQTNNWQSGRDRRRRLRSKNWNNQLSSSAATSLSHSDSRQRIQTHLRTSASCMLTPLNAWRNAPQSFTQFKQSHIKDTLRPWIRVRSRSTTWLNPG